MNETTQIVRRRVGDDVYRQMIDEAMHRRHNSYEISPHLLNTKCHVCLDMGVYIIPPTKPVFSIDEYHIEACSCDIGNKLLQSFEDEKQDVIDKNRQELKKGWGLGL